MQATKINRVIVMFSKKGRKSQLRNKQVICILGNRRIGHSLMGKEENVDSLL